MVWPLCWSVMCEYSLVEHAEENSSRADLPYSEHILRDTTSTTFYTLIYSDPYI